jgi:hypothetical protein
MKVPRNQARIPGGEGVPRCSGAIFTLPGRNAVEAIKPVQWLSTKICEQVQAGQILTKLQRAVPWNVRK